MKLPLHSLALVLSLFFQASAGQEVRTLEPGKGVESEIAGGQSHTYQISLTAGQFVRFRLEQRAIDLALILTAPDGKQLVEMNLTRGGDQESLSLEAAANGDYRLTIRASGSVAVAGSYQVRLEMKPSATAQDRQRISAERFMIEALGLRKPDGKTNGQAIDKFQQALAIWRELGEQYWVAWSHSNIGIAFVYSRQNEKAIESCEQALVIQRELKDLSGEGFTLNNLGGAYSGLNRTEEAIKFYEQALAIHRAVKNRGNEASTLYNLGLMYHNLTRYEKSIDYYEQSLTIRRELKDRAGEANTLSNLGVSYLRTSRYEKALECCEGSLAIQREVKNRIGEGRALGTIGIIYAYLSRYDKATEYYQQALAIDREMKNRRDEAVTLNSIGNIHNYMNLPEKAIEYYEQALAIQRETKNRTEEGRILDNLGRSYSMMGRFEKAIQFHEESLAILREMKSRRSEGETLRSFGDTYRKVKNYEKAVEYYEQGLTIFRELKDPTFEAITLYSIARSNEAQGDTLKALSQIEQSLKIAESLRSYLLSPESRASFLASVQGSYQIYTDLLMRQHKAEPSKGLDALAVEVSERQRARSLLDLLSEANTNLREGVDPALIERERNLAKQLNDKARITAGTPEGAAALKLEIGQLETDLERAQVAIRKANPHYAALTQPQPLKLREIQAQLDADTLLLEYALGEERSYLWAISKDSLMSYELPKGERIDKDARQLHELLSARSTSKSGESALQRQDRLTQAEANLPAAAQALSQILLTPVAAQLGNKRLVIVADGALQYIPFAMLPEPVVGKNQPLIVNHEIVSLPSASALAIQRAELAGRQPAPKMLAVIADPVFDRTDARFKSLAPETNDKAQRQTLAFNDARSIEHLAEKSDDKAGTTSRRVIPRLPFTRQEAIRLLALTPKNSSIGAIDFQASRQTVLQGELAQYRYVHFATHGLVDSERPGLSSLVLSMVDAEGKPQNGFLRLHEIYNLKLPAELVVLSACQTGIGKEIKGEGMEALTRGFMYAGAARVVVSLWNVNDKATAELMAKFYEKMLKQGERPAAALRAAQVEMWRQKQWQSPYYWAAFTLQGEWR
jgi:CHAT domain-containing protein/tetratricopeptide (TPR) repeat protein